MKVRLLTELKPFAPEWTHWSLKKGADLQIANGLSLTEICLFDLEELAFKFDELRVKNPARHARTLLNTLHDISIKYPSIEIPNIDPVRQLGNGLIPLRDEPRQLRIDLVKSYTNHKEGCAYGDGQNAERTSETLWGHHRRVRTFKGAIRRAPNVSRIGSTFGIEQMTNDKIAKIGFKQLTEEGYSKHTISMIGYSVAVTLRDVFGDDHAHLPWWQSYLAARDIYPSKALPFEKALRIQHLIVDNRVAQIMKAPAEMASRAYDAGLGRKDSTARLAYAVALSLKLNHIGITEGSIVRFDLKQHIKVQDGRTIVIVNADLKNSIEENIHEHSETLIKDLESLREREKLKHSLLFPRREDIFPDSTKKDAEKVHKQQEDHQENIKHKFRCSSSVMQGLYADIQLITGIVTTFSEIKDAMVCFLLEQGTSPFIVAKRAGYLNLRSLQLRHPHLFKAGLPHPVLSPKNKP